MKRIRGAARAIRWRGTGEDAAVLVGARAALDAAFGGAAAGVNLRLRDGLLTIRGEVERLDDIELYEAVVRRAPGVVKVDNLLRVRFAGMIRPHVLPA